MDKLHKRNSLLGKLIFPVIIVATLLVVGSYFYTISQLREHAIIDATSSAERTAQQFKTLRGYYTKNVIAKVIQYSNLTPSFDHKTVDESVPLPATMIHELSEQLQKAGTQIKLFSPYPFPNRSGRKLNQFERQAWDFLQKRPTGVFTQVEESAGKTLVKVGIPDTMQAQACIDCHNNHPNTPRAGWKLNDLRGVLEVEVDITTALTNANKFSTIFGLVLLGGFSLLIFSLAFIFRNKLVKRLESLKAAIYEVAKGNGDLTLRLSDTKRDEIGAVTLEFNQFMDELQELIISIIDNTRMIADISRDTSDKTGNNLQGLLQQSQDIKSMEHELSRLLKAISEVASNTQVASSETRNTQDITNQGKQTVDITVNNIHNMSASIDSAAQVIDKLAGDSEKITSVLEVIKGIADQTNLLALNAAIEAARAGEQGRGFAVVADEVRQLAGRTQQSVNDINEMIDQLQQAISNAVNAIKDGRELAEQSVLRAADAGSALEQITGSIEKITDMNAGIANSAEHQHKTTEALVERIVSINRSTSQVVEQSQSIASDTNEVTDKTGALFQRVSRLKV